MNRRLRRFVGAYGPLDLIGREAELQAIQAAVGPQAGDSFQAVFLVANGGVGKTRLLRETCWQLGSSADDDDVFNQPRLERKRKWQRDGVVCLQLVDVADPILHSQVAFLHTIRDNLGKVLPEVDGVFKEFDELFEHYADAREGGQSYQEVQTLRSRIVQSFQDSYTKTTEHHRVVWVLDTLEQLFGVDRSIERLLRKVDIGEEDIGQTTYNWLKEFIKRQPRNTTVLLAGRPEPPAWHNDFIAHYQHQPAFFSFELKPFSSLETKDYIKQLSKELNEQKEYRSTAGYLDEAQDDPDFYRVMHALSNGNPIRLGLYLDMVANIAVEPVVFSMSFNELQAQPLSLEELRQQVDDQLLAYIESGFDHPENSVLTYLFVTHRGLNEARLSRLWGGSLDQCRQVISQLREISFIKYRHKKIFLHDTLYEMHGEQIVSRMGDVNKQRLQHITTTHQKLLSFLEERIQQRTDQINDIRDKYEDGIIRDKADRNEVRKHRQDRRRYKAEALHYQLCLDPAAGFNDRYFDLAEQAFLGYDSDLDSYLQSEIDSFFFGATANLNRRLADLDETVWAELGREVIEERAIRWLKRIIQFRKVVRAQRFAHELKTRYVEIVPSQLQWTEQDAPPLFQSQVDAYQSLASIYQGNSSEVTLQNLEKVIQNLEAQLATRLSNEAMRPQLINTVATCYSIAGYGYTTIGNFPLARHWYQQAINILLPTNHAALLADVKNNLARVIGEMGYYRQAKRYCNEGLATRRNLGFDYALGLSHNTLSLIETRNGKPSEGIGAAHKALLLFRQLNDPRGIVLAATQLAQSKRREWRSLPISRRQISMLLKAEELLKEVSLILDDTRLSDERIRRIETYVEWGCLYRDWAQHTQQGPNGEQYEEALKQLERASEEAQDTDQRTAFQHYVLLAEINKAYLFYYCEQRELAKETAAKIWTMTPLDYKLSEERPLNLNTAKNRVIFIQLSKLFALRALLNEPTPDTFATILEHRILATTYSQLFSSFNHWYLDQNGDELRKLLARDTQVLPEGKRVMVREIIEKYHLHDLTQYDDFGPRLEVVNVLPEFTVSLT